MPHTSLSMTSSYFPYFLPAPLFFSNFISKIWGRGEWEQGTGREGWREREKKKHDLLFHSCMHSFVDSCLCRDWGSNPQPWYIRTMLESTELPDQGSTFLILNHVVSVNALSCSKSPSNRAMVDTAHTLPPDGKTQLITESPAFSTEPTTYTRHHIYTG